MASKTEMHDFVPFDVGSWTELNRLRVRKHQSEPDPALGGGVAPTAVWIPVSGMASGLQHNSWEATDCPPNPQSFTLLSAKEVWHHASSGVPTDAALSPACPDSLGTAQSRALVLGSPVGTSVSLCAGLRPSHPGKTRLWVLQQPVTLGVGPRHTRSSLCRLTS